MVKWRMGELPKLPQVLHTSVGCHSGIWAGEEGGKRANNLFELRDMKHRVDFGINKELEMISNWTHFG